MYVFSVLTALEHLHRDKSYNQYLRNRRYLLLYDRTDVVNNSTAQQVTHQISFPINMLTTYVYGTNTVASGSLIFVAITDSSLAPNPLLILNPRFTFKDY